MDNQEKQRDIQQEEKALKLFGLLQNVPEDLLERSEKKRPGVIAFIQKYNTTLVACIALLLIGVGFLGYRGWSGADNATSNDMAYDVGSSAMNSDGTQQEAAVEEGQESQYVADNQEVADMFQEVLTDTNVEADEAETGGADGAASEAEKVTPEGLASLLSVLDIPEGYVYENITSSLNEGNEMLAIRLQHADGNYMELVISGSILAQKDYMSIMDQNGKRIEVTEENRTFPVDESGVTHLDVYYENGLIVEYSGTADSQSVYLILESLK